MPTLQELLNKVEKKEWRSIWGGPWGLLHCSDWGDFYTNAMKVKEKIFLHEVIFLYEKGSVSAWVTMDGFNAFSSHIAKVVGSYEREVKKICEGLKKQADVALAFMDRELCSIDKKMYDEYRQVIREYYRYHIQVKYIGDALPEDAIKKYLPLLEDARVYAEPVFSEVTLFDNELAKIIGEKANRHSSSILTITQKELNSFFKNDTVPPEGELEQRWNHSALVVTKKEQLVFSGPEAKQIENAMLPRSSSNSLQGQSAFGGVVTGRVKIILDPTKANNFFSGDILVTRMTRPEYLQLMKKSAAIITDAGGILCHAAITARELKKPCVIGTKVATKIFKDGDLIEVDAEKGIVKKIYN